MAEAAPQRVYPLREIFNALRYVVRVGGDWRMMPHDLPPWNVVYQQAQRWIKAGCFEAMAHDLRAMVRLVLARTADPSAVILNSRTILSTPESGGRAGYDGAKKRKGSKVHAAVDTLGHLLAVKVTAANEQDRAQVKELAQAVQIATGEHVQLAYVDQGYTGEQQPQTRPNRESDWKWSNIMKPSAVLYCCRAAGSWNDPSPVVRRHRPEGISR